MKPTKILFVCPYPFDEAPSQRFRFEQYLRIIKKEGLEYDLAPFLNLKVWKSLYEQNQESKTAMWILLSFIKRFLLLFRLSPYQFIFIHREAAPLGPPLFEWITNFILRKKIIYDFDDAIWLEDPSEKGTLKALIKWKSKVKHICKWSYRISCGNEYLINYAKQYNRNTVLNPTTIDTNYHKPINSGKSQNKLTIGWTGTHSTLPYLKLVLPVLNDLAEKYDYELLIISNQKPDFHVPYMRFIKWNKSREIQDLNRIDIGIMPLTDDIWSRGKCGFKLLQYMSINKPTIASPVGVNEKLLRESEGGLFANNVQQWRLNLAQLLEDQELRKELGNKGRNYVQKHYSVDSNSDKFLRLLGHGSK